jgi:hypothetical protein
MRLSIPCCILALLLSSPSARATEPEQEDYRMSPRNYSIGGVDNNPYQQCATFIDDIEDLGAKADRMAHRNEHCRAASHYEKALRKTQDPPDACRERPDWRMLLYKIMGSLRERYAAVQPLCGAEKLNSPKGDSNINVGKDEKGGIVLSQ